MHCYCRSSCCCYFRASPKGPDGAAQQGSGVDTMESKLTKTVHMAVFLSSPDATCQTQVIRLRALGGGGWSERSQENNCVCSSFVQLFSTFPFCLFLFLPSLISLFLYSCFLDPESSFPTKKHYHTGFPLGSVFWRTQAEIFGLQGFRINNNNDKNKNNSNNTKLIIITTIITTNIY